MAHFVHFLILKSQHCSALRLVSRLTPSPHPNQDLTEDFYELFVERFVGLLTSKSTYRAN